MRLRAWLAFLFLAVATPQHSTESSPIKLEPYAFRTDGGSTVSAEFGELSVGENRKAGNKRLIKLAFVRFKSTAEKPGPPIIYLAGGPGGSGIATARSTRFPVFMAMRQIGDVIALDQRGVGLSKPNLTCLERLDFPVNKAGTREDLLAAFKVQSKSCAANFRRQGVDLSAYNTIENADDIEDLRRALGADKVILWGTSYGTHLALAYIKRYEANVQAAILAGVEGLDQTYKLPATIQAHLEKLNELTKAEPEIRAVVPDLLQLMKTVHEKLDRQPARLLVREPASRWPRFLVITSFDVKRLAASAMGGPEMSYFPMAYYSMSQGDFSLVAEQLVLERRAREIGSAMSYMMDCASGASAERLGVIHRQAPQTVLGDLINFPFPEVCEVWGKPDLGEAFRQSDVSPVPVLVISGTLDARTPVSGAEEVLKSFPNGKHLIIEGAIHGDSLFLSSPQIQQTMLEFLQGKNLSAKRIQVAPPKFIWRPMPATKDQDVSWWSRLWNWLTNPR